MGVKIRIATFGNETRWVYFCEGCGHVHQFDKRWTFNGNMEKPTFNGSGHSPSIKMDWAESGVAKCCHAIITDGICAFQSDCTHALAGQQRELQDVEIWDPNNYYGGGQ